MKGKKRILPLLIVAVLIFVGILTACAGVNLTLTFEVDGEMYATVSTMGQEAVEMPKNPEKEGYLFDGWYWDKDVWEKPFTANSLLDNPITEGMTVYAKFIEEDITKREFSVTFNSMGGSAVNLQKVLYNNGIDKPSDPVYAGYVFVGWFKSADFSQQWNFKTDKVLSDVTLYAKWVDEQSATGCEILTATGFTFYENEISIRVPNAQERFVLSGAITVSPYATWTVTTDAEGKEEIPSATVPLSVGDNSYYINLVSGTGSNKKQYEVHIRRREIYTVTYRFDNGTFDQVQNVEEDNKIETLSPQKLGYSLVQWETDGKTWDFERDTITKNVTLNAVWAANVYTVTFNGNPGAEVAAKNVTYDGAYTFDCPGRKGYAFNGWKTEEGTFVTGQNGVGLANWSIAENTALYADWQINTYTIVYNEVEGAGHGNPTAYTVETNDIVLSGAEKAGYTFVGWYSDEACTNKVTQIDTDTAIDVSLWAKWDLITYTAAFRANDRVIDTVAFTVESAALAEPSVPDILGYIGTWEEYEIAAQNLTIQAVYTPVEYTISYENTKDASNTNPKKYTIESAAISLSEITAVGYTFDGWYIGEEKVTEITAGSYGNRILTAKWTAIEYTISYVWDDQIGGYADNVTNPKVYTIEDAFSLNVLVNKTPGYISLGWFTEKNSGAGEKVSGITLGTFGNIVLYAHWGLEEYSITYHNIEGISETNAKNYTVETETFEVRAVSKTGYTFEGWYRNAEFTETAPLTIPKGSVGNLDYYAKWSPIVYTISYTLYGGSIESSANPETYTIEQDITFVNPKLTGYAFGGWYTASGGGQMMTGIKKGTTGNLSLYARWIHISTITFQANGGSAVAEITAAAGTSVAAPENPKKDFYDFAGWYSDESLTNRYEFSIMPENDISLYAYWTPAVYTIEYVLNGGINALINPDSFTVESGAVMLAAAEKEGYTFIGWFTSNEFTLAVTEIPAGSHGDITLYANYSVNQYTISFDTNGGTSVADITQNFATSVSAPADSSKNGYGFAGWYRDAALTELYSFTTMPAANITLHAKWELVTYTIVYHLDGGTNADSNPSDFTINSEEVTFGAPTKFGYAFDGWFGDSGYQTRVTGILRGSYGDKEFFAKWNVITYAVTYRMPEGASNANPERYTVETEITNLSDAVLAGYTFGGWYADEHYTQAVTRIAGGSVGDKTIFAKFTANSYTIWMDGSDEASYTVGFDLKGGAGNIAPQTVNENTPLAYPSIPTRSGYLFGGWYDNPDCNGSLFDFTAQVKKDITLYANWISCGQANPISVGATANVVINGQTEVIYNFVPLVSGNVTITASGLEDTFGRLYNANGVLLAQDDDSGADGRNFLMVYNVTAGKAYTVIIRGFGSTISGTAELSVNGNTTVPAGGYVVTAAKSEATFGQNFSLTVPAEKEGYKFLGYADADGVMYTGEDGNSVKVWDKAAHSVLYSVWERTVYTVTFMTNGGSSVETVTLAYGDRLDLNDYATTLAGKTFGGWYLSASDSEAYNATTMPKHNVTLYAKWITFSLGSIKYDTDKKAISVNDQVSAELFGAVCLDTNGNLESFTAAVSGTVAAGNTVSVRLVATSGGKTKQITISDVKVYDMPTLTVTNPDKGYVNLPDGLNGDWFGASGTDTFGNAARIVVRIEGNYAAGDTVTVMIDSVDPAGNVTSRSIAGVKLYGEPQITYQTEKTAISVNDTINAELFHATAKDSFGETVGVTASRYSGTFAAGQTNVVRLTATDGKGNVRNIDVEVLVYGAPKIGNAEKTEFKTEDEITAASLGLTAFDTYQNPLEISLSVKSGTQTAGQTMVLTASVTDAAGNVATKDIFVKIFGTPTVTYGRAGINEGEDATAVVPTCCTVGFDLNGASGIAPQTQTVTDTIGLVYPAIPTRSGYVFGGWYRESACKTLFDFGANVSEDSILYAKWIAYSGNGMIPYNGSLTVSVTTKSSSTAYYAFVPLVGGTLTVYSANGLGDTYGYLFDAAKKQLASDDDSGDGNNFKLTYTVTAGTLYYVRPCGYNSSGTTTVYVSGSQPIQGGKSSNVGGGAQIVLNAVATDSFGHPLEVTATLKSGTVTVGSYVVYTLTATDRLGNTAVVDTAQIGVYDVNDIQLSYFNMASDLVRLSSKGEEFSAQATDTFGEACAITIEAAEGFELAGGNVVSLYLVATDKAGNRKKSELIADVKVYDMPTARYNGINYVITADTDISFLFTVTDSFGEELYTEITVGGDLVAGSYVNITVKATDDAGNRLENIYQFAVTTSTLVFGDFQLEKKADGSYELKQYLGSQSEVSIPDHLVSSIAAGAFENCGTITKVIVPNSVTSIGASAFNGCNSLIIYAEAATKPSGWVSNWNYTNCPVVWDYKNNEVASDGYIYTVQNEIRYGIKDGAATVARQSSKISGAVTIPTSIEYKGSTYSVTSIGLNAFRDCYSLTSITIPNSVTSIDSQAFYNCSSLTSITIGSGVKSIGSNAFSGCSFLTSIVIPDGVTNIGSAAFNGCRKLQTITIPFVGATKDGTSNTHFGYIFGASSFRNNSTYVSSSLKEVIITGGTSIGNEAFNNCSSLTRMVIPNSVTSIEWHAFRDCSSLTSITIGSSVTSIGDSAFYNCSSLTSMVIPNSVTSIGGGAFSSCSSLTRMVIPNSVTSIGSSAFKGCSSLTSITIGSGVTSIGSYAFQYCRSLTRMVIPNSVTSIGERAFWNCSSLTSITIGSGVTSIGDEAFSGCSSLTNIVILNGITSIGYYAFETTAWYANQPDGAVYAGKVLHSYKGTIPSNTSVMVKEGTLGIAAYAFYNCSSLTRMVIPNSVTSIGDWAFYGCSSLTNIEIPNSVTSISYEAFRNCSSLTSIEIPNSVTSIEWHAFSNCTSLTSIVYGGTTAEWKAITKGNYWNFETAEYTVTCADGTLRKSES